MAVTQKLSHFVIEADNANCNPPWTLLIDWLLKYSYLN